MKILNPTKFKMTARQKHIYNHLLKSGDAVKIMKFENYLKRLQ